MAKVLVTMLGTNDYSDRTYHFHSKEYTTKYGALAIINLCFEDTSDLTVKVFATKEAENVHFSDKTDNPTLKNYLVKSGINYEFKHIPSEFNLGNSWEIFRIFKDNLIFSSGDELYIDITFGYRSQPTILLMTLSYLESLHNVTVKKVYYCKEDNTYSEIVDLTNMYYISIWAKSIETFIQTGQYTGINKLFNSMNNVSPLKPISNTIDKLAKALRLVKIGFYDYISDNPEEYKECVAYCVYKLHDEIYKFQTKYKDLESEIKNEYYILLDLFDKLKDKFKWINYEPGLSDSEIKKKLIDNYYLHLLEILKYYRDTELVQQGLTLINEIIFVTTKDDNLKEKIKKLNPEKYEGHKYLQSFWKQVDRKIYQENSALIQRLNKRLSFINSYRNSINHSFYINKEKRIKNTLQYKVNDIISEFRKFVNTPDLELYIKQLNDIHKKVYNKDIKILVTA